MFCFSWTLTDLFGQGLAVTSPRPIHLPPDYYVTVYLPVYHGVSVPACDLRYQS